MKLTPTTKPHIHIQTCKSTWLISVVGCGCVLQLLWERGLKISVNYFVMGLIENTMSN